MKKTLSVLTVVALSTTLAYAEGSLISAPKTLPTDLPEVTEVQDLPEFTPSTSAGNVYYNSTTSAQQNAKLQDALLKIDSAQVDVKNELNLYESKLVDVKNRENLVKQEKNGVLKQIRTIKKKMNALDGAKKKIMTNMAVEQQGDKAAIKHFNWFK